MNDRLSHLTVRVKLVDLNGSSIPSQKLPPRSSGATVSALVGSHLDRPLRLRTAAAEPQVSGQNPSGELCIVTKGPVTSADFENHIETCTACSNRVALQLDFIETLEVAMYQRQAEPASSKIKGALLISAPKLNFAICGEINI